MANTHKFKYMQKMFKQIGVSVNTNITKNKQFYPNAQPDANADDSAWHTLQVDGKCKKPDDNVTNFGQNQHDGTEQIEAVSGKLDDGHVHHFNQTNQVVPSFQDGRATQLLPLGVQPFRAYQQGAVSFKACAANQKNAHQTGDQAAKKMSDLNDYCGSLRKAPTSSQFMSSSESKNLFVDQQPNCTATLKAVAHSHHHQYQDPQQALFQHLNFQQGFNLSTSAVDQSMLAMAGAKSRQKKQMNFSSRKQMLKYIENFRVNYKTQLCRNFMNSGECEFKTECCYAHGHHELVMKPISMNKNYKTKMCKQWHEDTPGQCTYGDKCQFIHNELKHDCQVACATFGGSPTSQNATGQKKIGNKKLDRSHGSGFMEQKATKLTAINDKTVNVDNAAVPISQNADKESTDQKSINVQAQDSRKPTVGIPSATMNSAETHLNAVLSNYKYLSIIPLDINQNVAQKSKLTSEAAECTDRTEIEESETIEKIRSYDFDAMGGRRGDKQSSAADVFEFDEFKLIERNIKKEILDYSSEENTPACVNIEEPTSASSDLSYDDGELSTSQKALMAAGCASKDEDFEYDPENHVKTLGHHIMDRKRLRVFTTITKQASKKKTERPPPSSLKSSFSGISLMQCQQA